MRFSKPFNCSSLYPPWAPPSVDSCGGSATDLGAALALGEKKTKKTKNPKLYTSCLDSCDMVSHGVCSFGFFFVFSFFWFSLWSPLQRVAKYCFFLLFFGYFPCVFFWISIDLLTCILKKRAFYLDFEAMWCTIYCKLQCFLYFILGKQHPCEHLFCYFIGNPILSHYLNSSRLEL